jgi:hypothetical protein
MMVLSSLRPDASIVEYLEHRARALSLRGLVARTVLSLALVLAGLAWITVARPVIITLALAYFCYAAWGLADRARVYTEVSGPRASARYFSALCTLIVWLGVLSGISFVMSVGFLLLGAPWIL